MIAEAKNFVRKNSRTRTIEYMLKESKPIEPKITRTGI